MKFTVTPCACSSRTAFSAPACIAFQYLCSEPCGTAAIFNSIDRVPCTATWGRGRACRWSVPLHRRTCTKSQACAASYGETCRVETALCAAISWELLDAYDLPTLIGSSLPAPHPDFPYSISGMAGPRFVFYSGDVSGPRQRARNSKVFIRRNKMASNRPDTMEKKSDKQR